MKLDPDSPEHSIHQFYLINITSEPPEFRTAVKNIKLTTKCKHGPTRAVCVDRDGIVRNNMIFSADMKGYFIVYIYTNDSAGGDTARVKVC